MNHGLTPDTVEKINSVLAQFPEVEAAILYGSRAKGNYKEWLKKILLLLIGNKLRN